MLLDIYLVIVNFDRFVDLYVVIKLVYMFFYVEVLFDVDVIIKYICVLGIKLFIVISLDIEIE